MGVVSEFLIRQIARQVADRGLVVWYDPERVYESLAPTLATRLAASTDNGPLPTDNPPQTTHYTGSFLDLRKQIDPLLNALQPPQLVVYVPLERTETDSALIELDCAGVVMQPRQQPPACNTRLSVVARNALRPILGEDQVAVIEKQVEAGKLSLADLDALATKGTESLGVMSLIFGTVNPQEVALAFLHDDRFDAEVVKKQAQANLSRLLQATFEFDVHAKPPSEGDVAGWLTEFRTRLTRHVLLTDLLDCLGEDVPSVLASMRGADSPGGVEACVRLARAWRNSREVSGSYLAAAGKVEVVSGQWSVVSGAWAGGNAPSRVMRNAPLKKVEMAALRDVEREFLERPSGEALRVAQQKLSGFWAEQVPMIQARWALIAAAGEVLLEALRVESEIKSLPKPGSKELGARAAALLKSYATGDSPWCLLDTHHRHLESRKYNFDFLGAAGTGESEHEGLEKLIAKAEQRHTEVASMLARQFLANWHQSGKPLPGLPCQTGFYETHVKPRLSHGPVAYVWVDALRFEMARELARLLDEDFEIDLRPGIATAPTITEIGMAALLPGAQSGARVVSTGGGKLALEIGGKVVKDRKDRVAFLKETAGVPVFDCKLDDLLPKPSKKVKEGIAGAGLVLVTSQEIDELGETDTKLARLQMDSVLGHLRRAVRVLADSGISQVVLAADHGYLFADELGDEMKIDPPGGQTADLHRRVWVGVGGATSPSYVRAPLKSFGIDSEFDLATPSDLAIFKVAGGNVAYFHGGLSPQELVVPVLLLTARVRAATGKTGIHWTLTPGAAKLTTRFFSVQIGGTQAESSLFGFEPPTVRVEIRAGRKVVSTPVSASYGYEDATGEARLKVAGQHPNRIEPNTMTLMVTEEISQKTVAVVLLDARSGAELAKLEGIEAVISM